jgi:hypothetical protein
MKLSKKLAGLVLTASLVLGTSVTAFAAPNDDVIQALKDAKAPQTYIIQAENYLKTNTITAAQATSVKAEITKANDVLKAAGTTDLTKLSAAQKATVLAAVTEAGKDLGLTVNIGKASTGAYAITATNAAGAKVIDFSGAEVKQTGVDNTILALGAFLLVAAAGSVFAVKKVSRTEA